MSKSTFSIVASAGVAFALLLSAGISASAQGPGGQTQGDTQRIGRRGAQPSRDDIMKLRSRSRIVVATASVTPAAVKPGQKATLTVNVQVAPGYHIYTNKPGDEYVIPTQISLMGGSPTGVALGGPIYPASNASIPSPQGKGHIAGYSGGVAVKVPLTVAASAKPGTTVLTGTLRAQACNDKMCLPPVSLFISAPVNVVSAH